MRKVLKELATAFVGGLGIGAVLGAALVGDASSRDDEGLSSSKWGAIGEFSLGLGGAFGIIATVSVGTGQLLRRFIGK